MSVSDERTSLPHSSPLNDMLADHHTWDGITKAVRWARYQGIDLEDVQGRIRDEWDAQQGDNREDPTHE